MKNLLFVMLDLFYCGLLKAQTIDMVPDSIFDKNAGMMYYYVKCVVTNNSDEELLTWFSPETTDNQTDQRLINRYFGKIWGDFNLYSLLYEGLLYPHALSVIGVNFIKKIPVKHTFTYIFPVAETVNLSHIVVLKQYVVERYLKFALDDIWFYDLDEVFVKY